MRLCVKEHTVLNIQKLHASAERNSRTGGHAQLGRGLSFVIKAPTLTQQHAYLIIQLREAWNATLAPKNF